MSQWRPRPATALSEASLVLFMHGPHAITHAHYRDGVDDHLDHLELIINPQALAEAWRQHGEAVIAEATRRQLPRPLWVERELGLVERRRR